MPRSSILFILCLTLIGVAACGSSPAPTSTFAPAPQEPVPTGTAERAPPQAIPTDTEEPRFQGPGGTEPAPDITAEPPEEPGPDPGSGSEATSPAYDIHVTLSLQGPPCGGYTNAGGFLHLATEAVFRDVRFLPPGADPLGTGWGGFDTGGILPAMSVTGQGQVGGYEVCPVWDGDVELACVVNQGPRPFESRLTIMPGGDQLPPAGPTPEAMGTGGTFDLDYSLGNVKDLGWIMGWECGDFHLGCFGGTCGGPNGGGVSFLLAWDWVTAGQELTLEATTEDGWGSGEWTLSLVPADGD